MHAHSWFCLLAASGQLYARAQTCTEIFEKTSIFWVVLVEGVTAQSPRITSSTSIFYSIHDIFQVNSSLFNPKEIHNFEKFKQVTYPGLP